MNILCEDLPESVCVNGIEYPVYTDFRRWIKIETLLSEGATAENIADAVLLCYKALPKNLKDAMCGIAYFHGLGGGEKRAAPCRAKPLYSFECDGKYIYGAFWEKYGIDLSKAQLHWWQFASLFASLGECRFTKIVGWRATDLSQIKNKEQKRVYRKLKRLYALPSAECDTAENITDLF